MKHKTVLGLIAIAVTAATVAACSSSSKKAPTSTGSAGTGAGGASTSAASSASAGLPLNTNAGGTPVTGGTLHMLGTGDVDYLDPNITYYTVGYLAARMYSRQWVTYPATAGATTTIVPDIATELPTTANGGISADGLTYKLTIKSGVDWDTTPARQVTGADFVLGLQRTCNPAEPFGGMPDFETLIAGLATYCDGFAKVSGKSASAMAAYEASHPIAGVKVDPSNPLTVDYTLTRPASYFLSMLAMPAFSPAPKEYDAYIPASAALAQHTISDGPYKISSYDPGKSLDFVRNSSWSASTDTVRKAYVNEVDVNETGNQDSIQEQLQANTSAADMEWDAFPTVSDIPQLLQKKDANLNLQPTYTTNPYLIFNTVSPNNSKALANVKVRQALSEALNRAQMIAQIGGEEVNPPLSHILPAGLSGTSSNTSPSYYPYDPTKAKADLAAAGASNLTLKFLYRSAESTSKALFAVVQQQLAQIGVKVVGVGVPSADFFTKYLEVPSVASAGTWDMSLSSWGPDWYGDGAASFFLPLFYGNNGGTGSAYPPNGSDFGFYNSAATDQLITQAASSTSASDSAALWAKADAQVMNDAAIFPITSVNQPTYHASHVHNTIFIADLNQIDPTNVWLSGS